MHVDRFKKSTLPPARRVFGLFGNPDRMAVHVTPGAGHQPFETNRAALLWMERHLGLPNWTRDDIEAFPELDAIEPISPRLEGDASLPREAVERLVALTLEAASGSPCSYPRYRLNGVVPGLDAVAGRTHLLAAVAPRPLTICMPEKMEVLGNVRQVYERLGAARNLISSGE